MVDAAKVEEMQGKIDSLEKELIAEKSISNDA